MLGTLSPQERLLPIIRKIYYNFFFSTKTSLKTKISSLERTTINIKMHIQQDMYKYRHTDNSSLDKNKILL